jgi:integrase/recombinase XerD
MARKLPTFLEGDTPERLLRATDRERDRILLMAALYLGLRVSELCNLRVEHIDFGRRLLFVRQGKGSKDRALPIPSKFVGPLRGWVGGRKEGYVFPSNRGSGRLTPRAVQKLVKRVAEKAGMRRAKEPRLFTPHKFRHAMATRMLERGADIISVRDALGHESVATTQIYCHATPERLRRSMEI